MNSLFEKLKKIIEDNDKFIIMSHRKPDLDAIGSSFGIYEIINKLNKEAVIFLDNNDELHSSVSDAISLNSNINFVDKDNYLNYIDSNTVLVVLDVHQKERLYYKEILDNINNVVVIDHHIKNKDYIKGTNLFYIDSLVSSMAEIITYFSNYLEINLSNLTSTIMLAGLETDTNCYNLKTTDKTYMAASVLMSYGADNILKQELLKLTKEEYLKRADYIKNSYMLTDYAAVCILDDHINTNEELSSIAEEMLKFENVAVTFAIGRLEDKYIGISAKSIGNIDVCKIMKIFNGGGHLNNAAAQIQKGKIKSILNNISKALEEVSYESNIN